MGGESPGCGRRPRARSTGAGAAGARGRAAAARKRGATDPRRDPARAMISRVLGRLCLASLVAANNKAKRLAIRLTRWTGKSAEYVHPKHLLGDADEHYLYLA